MGVDIVQYCSKIGCFNSRTRFNKSMTINSNFRNMTCNNKQSMFSQIFIPIILWTVFLYISVPTTSTHSNDDCIRKHPINHVKEGNNLTNPPTGMFGFSTTEVNKINHIMNGNRRNIGYTYMTWNCDKGYLNNKKIDDIKLAASMYKPEIIGVSEVKFKRDDNNVDDDKQNNLTTEQLKKKILITDYNTILPESWNRHGIIA